MTSLTKIDHIKLRLFPKYLIDMIYALTVDFVTLSEIGMSQMEEDNPRPLLDSYSDVHPASPSPIGESRKRQS
jgi:hypothetical protein